MWFFTLIAGCTPEPECRADVGVYEDLDGDGFGTEQLDPVCEQGEGQALVGGDCDDASADVHPDAPDRCNGVDDDCDGWVDGKPGSDKQATWFRDRDGDGFGDTFPSMVTCEEPGAGWVENDLDCDDTDAGVNPDARERCRGGDEDCDGLAGDFDDSVDPDTYETFYRDADLDSYGAANRTTEACQAPTGYVPNDLDCDDGDATFSRNTYYRDLDDDGFGDPNDTVSACTLPNNATLNNDDCDDTDPAITDEHDWFEDTDGDGWGEGVSLGFGCLPPSPGLAAAAGDCAPADPTESPATPEVCDDGLDQNCDGAIDCDDDDCVGIGDCIPPCADLVLDGALPTGDSGSTTGMGNDASGTCGGGSAADVVYQWVPDVSGNVTIDTIGSNYDTVLVVRDGCGGPQLGCNDDAVGLQSRVVVNVTAGVPVIIIVDGYSGTGQYVLNLQ